MFGLKKKAFNGREKRISVVFDKFSLGKDGAAGALCASKSVNCDCRDGVIRSGLGLRAYKIDGTSVLALSGEAASKFFLLDTAADVNEVGSTKLYCLTEEGEAYGYTASERAYAFALCLAKDSKFAVVADQSGNKFAIFSSDGEFYVKTKTGWRGQLLENATTAICACKNRVFIGVKPATVAYSNPLSPSDFTAAKETAGKVGLVYDFGEIVALICFQNSVFVFHEHGVVRMEIEGLATEFKIEPLDYAGGEIYGNSVGVCGNSVFFLAVDGAYRFDGKKFHRVAEGLGIAPNPTVKDCAWAVCGDKFVLRYTGVDGNKRCAVIAADGKSGYFMSDREGLSQCGGAALCRSGSWVYALSEGDALGSGEAYEFTSQTTDFGVTGRKMLRKLRFEGEGSVNVYVYSDGLVKNEMKYFVDGVADMDVFVRGGDFYFTFLLGEHSCIRKIAAELSVAAAE